MRKLLKEFREFALKGSVIDLAVGVIIGAAFGKIVSSLVNDVITPFISMFLGGVDFASWEIELPRLFGQLEPIIMKPGIFLNTIIEFIILAFVIFILVKAINKARRKKEQNPPEPAAMSKEEVILTEIRDILKDK